MLDTTHDKRHYKQVMLSVRNQTVLKDIVTPANAITIAGLLLTLFGALRLDTVSGLVMTIAGRGLDMVDGPVSRRTHTSHIGALLDAGSDKVSMLALLIAMYYFGLAPTLFLSFIFVYHAAIVYMSLSGEKHGVEAKPTVLGKYTMFLHLAALLSFALSADITSYTIAVYDAAAVLALAGVVAGVISLYRYVELYIRNVRSKLHK